MLATSNEIFLVLTPEVGALRNSTQFLDLARDLGLINVIRVIVNRANHGIRLEDMSATLGLPISGTIVSSGPKAVIASNEGRPIVLKFPRDQISNDLHRVARLVTHTDEPQPTAPRQSRKWFSFGARTSRA
jgi:pilus assembly protein CpaE